MRWTGSRLILVAVIVIFKIEKYKFFFRTAVLEVAIPSAREAIVLLSQKAWMWNGTYLCAARAQYIRRDKRTFMPLDLYLA